MGLGFVFPKLSIAGSGSVLMVFQGFPGLQSSTKMSAERNIRRGGKTKSQKKRGEKKKKREVCTRGRKDGNKRSGDAGSRGGQGATFLLLLLLSGDSHFYMAESSMFPFPPLNSCKANSQSDSVLLALGSPSPDWQLLSGAQLPCWACMGQDRGLVEWSWPPICLSPHCCGCCCIPCELISL